MPAVHCIACLPQANEDHVEGFLPNAGELLNQLDLHHDRTRPLLDIRHKPVKAVVKWYFLEPNVQDDLQHFLAGFQETNPTKVAIPLGDQHNYQPKHLAGDVSLLTHREW